MEFIPLHVYSEYSFLNSGLTLDKYLFFAKKYNYSYVGVSDYKIMFSFPTFTQKAKALNLKPILGMDAKYSTFTISFYVLNEIGYRNLIYISNLGESELTFEILKNHNEGLLKILSVNTSNFSQSYQIIDQLTQLSDFIVGLELYHFKEQNTLKDLIEYLATKSIPVVAFPHIKYLKSEDGIVLDIVNAIKNNETLSYKSHNGDHYLFSPEEIKNIYQGLCLKDLTKLFDKIEFNLNTHRGEMLKLYPLNEAASILKAHCLDGLKNKQKLTENYLTRLNQELKVIDEMGFNNYFLIVEDYVKYAKNNNILVGPGRGSAAGSLVSYALDITIPDPLEYDLYFERFLNSSRRTMPDIDIDFEDIYRDNIVTYLKEKYGKSKVSNIVTFQTIGAKQALRDIGRVFQIDSFEIDYLSKALGSMTTSFKEAYKNNVTFKNLVDQEPHYLEIVRLASKIEGLIRQSSIHPAGIILNDVDIETVLPVLKDDAGNLIAQYEMTDLEVQGFLKMDILSLKNLTIIKDICNLVNINPYLIPIDDKDAIKLIHDNSVMGIFQLESNGMRRAIEILKPSSFDDIAALIALFRPGPMDNIPTYAKRKQHLESVDYPNSTLAKILQPTYGIIVYQEQIMQIATLVAGLSLLEADNFRRSISKKDLSKMEKIKDAFITGCLQNHYSLTEAENIYQTIIKFASYGFNKAHSISYAYICSEMAYLKAHYPLEFYITILEHESGYTNNKLFEYLKEIKQKGIELLPPNINNSQMNFSIFNGKLLFPLMSIRSLQSKIVQAIIDERSKNGKFTSFFDFVTRLYPYGINEATISRLIDAGAFDQFSNRASLRASIPNALSQAMVTSTLQYSLFSQNDIGLHFDYIQKDDDKLLNLSLEYDALGIMISSSPLKYYKDLLLKNNVIAIKDAKKIHRNCSIAIMVIKTRVIKTKKGLQMANIQGSDEDNDIEVVVFTKEYAKYWNILKTGNLLLIKGYVSTEHNNSFLAREIINLEDLK